MESGSGSGSGSKRTRIEEEESVKDDGYPLIRDRPNPADFKMSLDIEFIFDPPEIDRYLAFTVNEEIGTIQNLTSQIYTNELKIEDLSQMIAQDPRLGSLLDRQLLYYLVDYVKSGTIIKIKCHAIVILKYVVAYSRSIPTGNLNLRSNSLVVMQRITPIMAHLMCSEDRNLREEAFWLLRAIALAFSDHLGVECFIENILDLLTSFLLDVLSKYDMLRIDESLDYAVIYSGIMTLAGVCQVHPLFPRDKLESTLRAIRLLLTCESEDILSNSCLALACLCDGRKAMVVERDYFNDLIDRLVSVIDSDSRVNTIAGLAVLGSIVRWGNDYNIEVIIGKNVLWSLECLLRQIDKYYVMEACWILSNITARKQNHIQAVIDCKCIDSLVGVIKDYNLPDVRKEATWAILNAIYRGSATQIKCLREKCAKPLWDILEVYKDDLSFVGACLKGLVKLKVLIVKKRSEAIYDADFETYFARFQLIGIEGSTQSKTLWIKNDENVFDLTCTFDEDQGPIPRPAAE